MPNGIDCCNNQTLLICVAMTPFDWDWIVTFNKLLCEINYFLILLTTGMKICLT